MRYRGYCITIIGAFLLILGGCKSDSRNAHPTIPTGDDVIFVDSQRGKTALSSCGTVDAACATLSDALASAKTHTGSIPTIWLKSGTYVQELHEVAEIKFPIILKAEYANGVILQSENTVLSILSSGVVIEGIHFISSGAGETAAVAVDGGKVTFKETTITRNCPAADLRGAGLSIRNNGLVILENSRVESNGSLGVEVDSGKISSKNSVIQASEALVAAKNGRATLENSKIEGNIFTRGGSLVVDNCQTKNISIADGSYATLSGNTIHGWVSLLWKHAYADISRNIIHGRVSAIEAKADLQQNTIYGNEQGEGVTACNSSELRLDDNTILGAKNALYAQAYSLVYMKDNQFDSATPGEPAVKCDNDVTLESEGGNTLQQPDLTIACQGLPSSPGSSSF